MQYDEFIGQVQHRAQLASSGDAVMATRATLNTLAERLAGNAPDNLAAQLPDEVGRFLIEASAGEPFSGESFDCDEFFQRVNQREKTVDLPKSVHHARAVIEVLEEAVSAGELEKIRVQLPAEFDPLFESGSTGKLATGDGR